MSRDNPAAEPWATKEDVAFVAEVLNDVCDAMTQMCDIVDGLAKDDVRQRAAISSMVDSQRALIEAVRIVSKR